MYDSSKGPKVKIGANRFPMTRPEGVMSFIKGGMAVFSLKSRATEKHFTYRVKRKNDIFYVMFLGGSSHWHYMGNIDSEDVFSKNRKVPAYIHRHEAFLAFEWFWGILKKGRLPQDAEVFHEGKCAMCGRKLTDPISVQEGLGPECRQKRLQHSAIQ